mmetsp:Transcript_19330/g.60770  ORF Transcript_19330/g.60770 Transcript_19330/m.60770 type:complete len:199 (+) Transcript_19330:50-646(+)
MAPLRLLLAATVAGAAWGRLRTAQDAHVDVTFQVSMGGDVPKASSFTVRVHPDWAPKGAAQFKRLIEEGWYDGAGIFRVVPGFVSQFGLPATPHPELPSIKDDPVKVSNRRGTLTFATAGPNTRTSQLFFNTGNNGFLDDQGFSPFAEVLGDGMGIVDAFFSGYGERPSQGKITHLGNVYLDSRFPKLSKIGKLSIQN